MFHNELEEILRKKFEAEHTDVDHDALWDRVYPEIKKDRKKPLWIWFTGLGLILMGVALIWIWNPQEIVDQNVDHEAIVDMPSVDRQAMMVADEPIAKSNLLEPNKVEEVEDLLERESNVLDAINTSSNDVNVSTQSNVGLRAMTEFVDHKWSTKREDALIKADDNNAFKPFSTQSSVPVSIDRPDLLDLSGIESLALSQLFFDRKKVSFSPLAVAKKEEKHSVRGWSIESLIGYGFADRLLSSIETSSMEDLEWRSVNEEALDALSVDLMSSYRFAANWKTRIGLDYQMITDRTRHVHSFSEVVDADNALGIEFLQTTLTETKYNYYNSIGVPMQLVYVLGNESVGIELGIGMRISKLFATQGIVHTATESYDLNTDTENRYGRNINLDLLGDVGVYVSLSQKLNWISRIQYQYGLNGVNTPLNPIEQKYNLLKIKTGLTYQF